MSLSIEFIFYSLDFVVLVNEPENDAEEKIG